MPNPFFAGGRINDPQYFVGREAQLSAVFAALETAHTGQLQSVSIVGPHRMGRSSLLVHLTQTYPRRLQHPERYRFAYVDLQRGECAAQPLLLQTILRAAEDPSGFENPKGLSDLSLADFEAALRRLGHGPGDPIYPVILLDEFEALSESPDRFPDRLYDSWRSLINDGCAAFVIASARPLSELARADKLTSDFFNVFTSHVPLGKFTPPEADKLLDRGRASDRAFDNDDCARAAALAGGRHPLRLQLAGRMIYDAKVARSPNWGAVEREYHRTIGQIFAADKKRRNAAVQNVGVFVFVRVPEEIGSFVLARLRHTSDDRLFKWFVGVLTVAAIAVIILSGLWR